MTTDTTTDAELLISGMTCASCANRIERKLNKVEGVEAVVNYATGKAKATFDDTVTREDLIACVEAAGYGVVSTSLDPPPPEADQSEAGSPQDDDAEMHHTRQRVVISALLSLPVIVLAMVPAWQFEFWQWASLTLAAPVVVWGGWPFHVAAWRNLRHGTSTMDTLVSLGTLAAFGWSLYALFLGTAGTPGMVHGFDLRPRRESGAGNIYLEVAAGVTTFLLVGRYFEARAKRRAQESNQP